MYKLRRGIDISIVISNLNARQFFKEQTSLRGVSLKALVATTFLQNGAMTPTFLQQCKITLVNVRQQVVIEALPLYLFDPKQNANGLIQELNLEQEIDWVKSYIDNPNYAATGGSKIEVFALYDEESKR